MIRHIVSWKLKATDLAQKQADAEGIATRLGALVPLIPEIKHLQVGIDFGTLPGNWDVVLVSDFDSVADLDVYQIHPEHLDVVDFVRSVVSDRAAVDFEL
jgi:hypothetical protein